MVRKPRVHYAGAIYHVIARGNNRENIFLDCCDKEKYLELVARYKKRYNCEILAYVLMDNHLHILIRIDQTPLSKVMQGIQQCYTQYFNQKYKHIGHVFQQRYKAFLCDNDSYLTALVVYIHQNPIRAKLPEGTDYLWSSHKDYTAGNSVLVDIDFILNMLHPNRREAYRKYFDLCREIQVPQAPPEVSLPDEVHIGREEDQRQSSTMNKLTWQEIVKKIIIENNIEKEKLLGRCRERKIVAARNMLIYEAINQEVLSRRELAKILQVDPARITRGFQKVEESIKNKSKNQA
ncbi:transposase [Desulforamulus ruminis]|uniref:Transposase-like protein n=1 Tax=Desulforamulus ruminis (strain ATCC 23193 / DSM 2154 / NCIMB 8452 / DL) TaxID=696281 RepID=F6DQA9_DESRL|nr:transposase [Desulforamulus ruminis]AEG59687.1 transposase-like protein [Desulforamulus ruminis DSM 2154]